MRLKMRPRKFDEQGTEKNNIIRQIEYYGRI